MRLPDSVEYIQDVAGCRTVPVEVGSRYTDDEWSQRLMTVGEFISTYVLGEVRPGGRHVQGEVRPGGGVCVSGEVRPGGRRVPGGGVSLGGGASLGEACQGEVCPGGRCVPGGRCTSPSS